MRILVYSDVHGNLPAFEKMLRDVGPCDSYVSLGDLVNYGPWSNECVDLASSLPNSVLLMGNHEEAFIAGSYPGENQLVKAFFECTHDGFTRFEQIKKFTDTYLIDGFTLVHTIQNTYVYPDTSIELDGNYVIGHSHHQFVLERNEFKLYNAGSVGQNRKYINVINYLVYDSAVKQFEMGSLEYNVDQVINEMILKKYPQQCVDYYKNKPRV